MAELYVVVGGGSGMGRTLARRLAHDGHHVLVTGRRAEALDETAQEAPDRIGTLVADASTVAGAQALAAQVDDRSVAGVVTAAGGQGSFRSGPSGPEAVRSRWAEALEKNFFSALLPVETLAPHLLDGRGRVVLIGSTAGLDGQGGPYASAKAALTGYAMDLARRLGPRGITANVVAPGFVAGTEFFEAGGLGSADPLVRSAAEATLVGRVGAAEDVAHIVMALLAEDAGWITGQVISPNGGALLR